MNFTDSGIEGFDVSFYQDDNNTLQGINFQRMKNWGADFVIIRAGQGAWIDPDFIRGWEDAKTAGIPRAAYWFYDPRTAPRIQASNFWNLVKNDLPEGRLWIDLEFPDIWGGSYTSWQNWKLMIEELKLLGATRIGIYTANWWWSKYPLVDTNYFGQYPLWVAQYTSRPEYVTLPKGWSTALIWQDGTPAIGIEVGVESIEIDHNKFNGGAVEFEKEFKTWVTVPPPVQGDIMLGTMLNYTVNVRSASGVIMGALRLNDSVSGEIKGAYPRRIYFSSVKRANGTIWNIGQLCSAVVENDTATVAYMKLEPDVVVPPPVTGSVPFTLNVDGYKPVSGNLDPL